MTVEEMLAREEIRQLMAAYNIAGDSGRRDDFAAVFTEDAVLDISRGTFATRQGIVDGLFATVQGAKQAGGAPSFKRMRHHLTTSQIHFTGPDSARGRTYFFVVTEQGPDHGGVYMDEFRRDDGRWLIARRQVRVEYMEESSPFAGQ